MFLIDWSLIASAPMGHPEGEDIGDGADYTGGGDESVPSRNPAWDALLGDIPEDYHGKVLPHLQQWDSGVNTRFEKVQSEYRPWRPLIDSGTTPDIAQFGVNLLRLIEENPEFVVNQLQDLYKDRLNTQQTQDTGTGQGQEESNPYQEHLRRLEKQQEIIARTVLAQRQAAEQARQDQEYEQELKQLSKKYGPFEEEWVNARVAAGMEPEEAVKSYKDLERRIAKNYTPPPRILGSGGGMPGQQKVDVTKLSPSQTNNLVAEALKAHNRARQQG